MHPAPPVSTPIAAPPVTAPVAPVAPVAPAAQGTSFQNGGQITAKQFGMALMGSVLVGFAFGIGFHFSKRLMVGKSISKTQNFSGKKKGKYIDRAPTQQPVNHPQMQPYQGGDGYNQRPTGM